MSFSKFDPLTPEVIRQIGDFCVDHLAEIFPTDKWVSRKRKRRRNSRVDYWSTPWGLMLKDRRLSDERSELSKLFRLRFRVPFSLFRDILVPMCREKKKNVLHRARVATAARNGHFATFSHSKKVPKLTEGN